MTRKHFETVANTIAIRMDAATAEQKLAIISLARGLARDFAGFNPRFDGDRFLKACGVKD